MTFEPSDDIERRFTHHPPDEARATEHVWAREILKDAAAQLSGGLPDGREKSLVLTKLEEAMFWANAAIARQGK